jgi:hypothetical protein
MRVRIRRNTHPNAWSQCRRNRLCNAASAVVVEREDSMTGDIVVRSRFHCAEYLQYQVRNFTGRYRHNVKKAASGYPVELQRVDLVIREGPSDYVMQWWL